MLPISLAGEAFFGPLGLKVMTVNKLERAYITSDCHKIFDQIEMGGPDSKIFLDAINMQYEEAGDGCKLLILFGCELISELKALVAQVILNLFSFFSRR